MSVVYISGTWDPFHIGHLNVIQVAAGLGDILVIGVATDDYLREFKDREPFSPFCDRARILSELRSVDFVIPYHGMEDMIPIDLFNVDIVIVDQQCGKGDSPLAIRQSMAMELLRERDVSIVTVPRTLYISSTLVRSFIND